MITCSFCTKDIERESDVYIEVIGFAKKRQAGGLHALIGRRPTGNVICNECITLVKNDIPVGVQSKLFDDVP